MKRIDKTFAGQPYVAFLRVGNSSIVKVLTMDDIHNLINDVVCQEILR